MRKLAAIFILLMSFLTTAPALAAGEITISDNTVLRWQTGNLNINDFIGDARGVSVNIAGEEFVTADRVILESEKNGDTVTSTKIRMTNLQFATDDTSTNMTIRNIELQNLVPTTTTTTTADTTGNVSTSTKFNFYFHRDIETMSGSIALKGLDIEYAQAHITADEISVSGEAVDTEFQYPTERKSLGEFLRIRNLAIEPLAGDGGDLFAALAGNGKIAIDSSAEIFVQKRGGLNDTEMVIDISVKDLMRGRYSLAMSASDEIMDALLEIADKPPEDISEEETNMAATLLLTQTFLKESVLAVEDTGMLAVLKKYFREQEGEDLVDETMEVVVRKMSEQPAALAIVREPLRAFLEKGGTITFRLSPSSPQPLGTLLAVQQAPEAILQVLGFGAEHTYP